MEQNIERFYFKLCHVYSSSVRYLNSSTKTTYNKHINTQTTNIHSLNEVVECLRFVCLCVCYYFVFVMEFLCGVVFVFVFDLIFLFGGRFQLLLFCGP